ncbi:amino acid ABC transporter substrate-binding protein [Stutzerimonas stutzeri]|uniref:Amino acid ABC transporter substrate-binding protein n=1 Tax=Stutzerimonas stutzeri TaxID=316 RepID=W8R2M6_STUST|nr:hypothetical protein [Stutzerimonas stutzeri]AHL73768.1 amino acid ABC transporter substrate-binding protein [Stutzerimonas stutzeri]MCQ4328716.1 hypothetical protein [Stutzerimonas stutzeri]
MLSGRIVLRATADPVWRYHAKQRGADGLQKVLSFQPTDLYLALNKDTPAEAVNRLQQAPNEVISEGYARCSETPDLRDLIRDRKAP